MKSLSKLKSRYLDQGGFAVHLILPIITVLTVVFVAGYVALGVNHADPLSVSETCRGYQFSQGSNTLTSAAKKNVNATHCVTYIQDIVNAAYERNSGGYVNVAKAYDKYYGTADGEIAGVGSGSYNLQTKVRVMAFQATFDFSDHTTGGQYEALSIDGITGPNTWSALCGLAGGWKSETSTWAKQSYAAYTVAASGCQDGSGGAVRQRTSPVLPGSSQSGTGTTGTGSGTGGSGGSSPTANQIIAAISCQANFPAPTQNRTNTYYGTTFTIRCSDALNGRTSGWEPIASVSNYDNYAPNSTSACSSLQAQIAGSQGVMANDALIAMASSLGVSNPGWLQTGYGKTTNSAWASWGWC